MMEKLKSSAEELGINLTPLQIEQFEVYYHELIAWNKRINLTSITDYEDAQIKHFLDSLTVAEAIDFKNNGENLKVIDVGTGAGLPGIPLKIVFLDIKLTLLEATIKKTKFLEHLIEKLDLKNVEIVAERAETAAHDVQHREKYDVVLARAVATLPALAELLLPFCNIGGKSIVQKKGDIKGEVEQAEKAITLMGGSLREVRLVKLKELNDNRWLIIIDKVKSTPALYPRRPGMPEKRPVIS
ncbi:MAG: 16S rRNA (guanine(527)-N(7))-methyltransferase RsmG [Dehalococcoidales bacterium]